MNPKYRFFLTHNYGGETREQIYPLYGDGLSLSYELEGDEKFYRKKLGSGIKLLNDEYDKVDQSTFDFEFILEIEREISLVWTNEYTGYFYKTDCKFNRDDKILEVKTKVVDDYTDILEGMEKEFNLIDLNPELTEVVLSRRIILQIYIRGHSRLTNYQKGVTWEQDASVITDKNALTNTYFFSENLEFYYIIGEDLTNDITGKYDADTLIRDDNVYYIQEVIIAGTIRKYEVRRVSDNVTVFWSDVRRPTEELTLGSWLEGATFANNSDFASADEYARCDYLNVYARLITNSEEIQSLPTYTIPDNDIVFSNPNYTRCIGIIFSANFIPYGGHVEESEGFGKYPDGTYYAGEYFEELQLPPSSGIDKVYPVGQSGWSEFSLWFYSDIVYQLIEDLNIEEYILGYFINIGKAIKVLLEAIGTSITHDATSDYSQFLYGSQNPISSETFKLFITQKSNILIGEFTEPAKIAKTTLQKILMALRASHRIFWHVSGGKLILEHVYFYDNGLTYSGSPGLGYDITNYKNFKVGKYWTFATNNIEFEKAKMPERIESNWMDKVSKSFEGYPIIISSNYVEKGNVEKRQVTDITTDLDYMIRNPTDVSKEGFCMVATQLRNNTLYEPPADQWAGIGSLIKSAVAVWIQADSEYTFGQVDCRMFKTGGSNIFLWTLLVSDTYDLNAATILDNGSIASGFNTNVNGHQSFILNKKITTEVGKYYWMQVQHLSITTPGLGIQISPANPPYEKLWAADNFGDPIEESSFFFQSALKLREGPTEVVPLFSTQFEGDTIDLNNGLLSNLFLHPNYHTRDMPSDKADINNEGEQTYANNIVRLKIQQLKFPLPDDEVIDPQKLIRTDEGDGLLESIQVNLSSRFAEIKLKHDTDG